MTILEQLAGYARERTEKAKQKNPVFKFSKFSKYYIQYQPAHSISYQQYDNRIGTISKSYEGPSFGY
jgi:hypothetical protein